MKTNVIEIHDLCFSYPDKKQVLKEITFSVGQGEALGIIGPNGSGKSTLLFHLNGLYRGEGHVGVLGMEPNKENIKAIRAKVGLVFQDPRDQLFMPTVKDDIAFGLFNMNVTREVIEEKILLKLEQKHRMDTIRCFRLNGVFEWRKGLSEGVFRHGSYQEDYTHHNSHD